MTNTITLSNREMTINKVGETFTEGAFEVVAPNGQLVFTAPTNKACVLFLAKNKTIEIKVAEVVEETETFGITRTGAKMLTLEEEVSMGYSVRKEVISTYITKNDKEKEVLVFLDSTGAFNYYQLLDGERFGKEYFLNTPQFKYVREDNKRYKSKLPKWITAEELNAMY